MHPARRLSLLAALLLGAPLGAQVAPQREACPAGDLLAGLRPSAARDVVGDPGKITDQRLAAEAALWDVSTAVRLEGTAATLTWDFGAPREVRALALQADANDRYPLSGSLDGLTFTPLAEFAGLADTDGLRRRTTILAAPQTVRYLRLDPPDGDGYTSVSELEAFCQIPPVWPPPLPAEALALPPTTDASWWTDLASRRWELVLALLGIVLLTLDGRRERTEGAPRPQSARFRLFVLAALVAGLTYFNFGVFHFGGYVHKWDTLHYYVGAKYFPELGYERLYECIAVADASEPRLVYRVQHRKITDLRTNVLGSTAEILAHPERCTGRFSAERWSQFRADLAYFREREAPQRWEDLSSDHGFNGTPVWLVAGTFLANLAPAGTAQIHALTLLDLLYFAALVAAIAWAFGLRTLAVGLLVFSTFFPCRFFWTGGSFLRWDWLFFTVASVACLKKGRPWLGGLALGYAAMLRIFPGLLAAGPFAALVAWVARDVVAGAGWRSAIQRPEVRAHLRFLAGAALAALILVPLSLATTGGTETWRAFVANTRKHQATPLTNHMGLRTVVAYRPSEVGRYLVRDQAPDPWLRWKEARLAAWQRARPFAFLLALGALILIGRASLRHPEPWIAAALGAIWIAFAVELTSYYYAFVIVPALLWAERRSAGIALLALSAFSTLVSFGPQYGLPGWRDEQFTLIAFATLAVFAGILISFGAGPRPTGRRS